MGALISQPLKAVGMTTADVDKYSAELQNPEITQPAGAGNVPESNYKMIAALSVMEGWLERSQINEFVARHGMLALRQHKGIFLLAFRLLVMAFAKLRITPSTTLWWLVREACSLGG